MFHINDQIILLSMSELRKEVPKISKDLKMKTVILTNRGKPIAVLEDYAAYQEKEKLMEELEDIVLGHIAKERAKNAKSEDFVPIEIVAKRLGINFKN